MKAFVFPGQGSQFEGMGKELMETSPKAKELFEQADDVLGYSLSEVMVSGTADDLKETKITQPAVFTHSVIKFLTAEKNLKPEMVAGHSLGEFSALVASGALNFIDGLKLVKQRAMAMQKACELQESTMAAIVGLDDEVVEKVCAEIPDLVVPANYNCPGQLVISGSIKGIEAAVSALQEAGARRAIVLQVGGAFHSPLMEPAKEELKAAIEATSLAAPNCPIYQNVTAKPSTDPEEIQMNLIEQLTAPVKWTQTMHQMIADGASQFYEVGGNGKVIRGFIRRVDRSLPAEAI